MHNYEEHMNELPSGAELKKIVDNVNAIIMTPLGRGGSYFFHSLMDGHEEVSLFPEAIYNNFFCDDIKLFVDKNSYYFSNKRNEFAYTDKNLSFDLSAHIYIYIYNKFCTFYNKEVGNSLDSKLDGRIDFILKHLAFSHFVKQDITKIKYIFCHMHGINPDIFLLISSFFVKPHLILMTRDVRETSLSFRDAFVNMYNAVKENMLTYCLFNITISGLFGNFLEILKYKENYSITIIDLNSFHKFQDDAMIRLCNKIGITYNKTMLFSSVLGNEWVGNSGDKTHCIGFDISKSQLKYKQKLTMQEIEFIDYFTYNISKTFGYEVGFEPSSYQKKMLHNYDALLNPRMYLPINGYYVKLVFSPVNSKLFHKFPYKIQLIIRYIYLGAKGLFLNLKWFRAQHKFDPQKLKEIDRAYKNIHFRTDEFLC